MESHFTISKEEIELLVLFGKYSKLPVLFRAYQNQPSKQYKSAQNAFVCTLLSQETKHKHQAHVLIGYLDWMENPQICWATEHKRLSLGLCLSAGALTQLHVWKDTLQAVHSGCRSTDSLIEYTQSRP